MLAYLPFLTYFSSLGVCLGLIALSILILYICGPDILDQCLLEDMQVTYEPCNMRLIQIEV